jgi:hypothetical protein
MLYQRYVDADLAAVEPVVSLEQRYGERSLLPLLLAGGALLLIGGATWLAVRARRGRVATERVARFRVPESVSPFTVIGLLRSIEAHNGVSHAERDELQRQISALERHYFDDQPPSGADGPPDLHAIAERWVEVVGRG